MPTACLNDPNGEWIALVFFTSDPERAKWRKDYNYGRALQVGSASNNDAYEMITRAFSKTSRTPVAVTVR